MADLTENEVVAIRRFVGSREELNTIQDAYDRQGSLKGAAVEILDLRLADMLTGPLAFTIVSEYSQNDNARVQALRDMIAKVGNEDDDLTGAGGGTNFIANTRRYVR